jgi:hypothetical protein
MIMPNIEAEYSMKYTEFMIKKSSEILNRSYFIERNNLIDTLNYFSENNLYKYLEINDKLSQSLELKDNFI